MSPGGLQHLLKGVKMFWFIPKFLAGFGPPCCVPACCGEGSKEIKSQGKPKRLLQHLAGTTPCPFLLAWLCWLQPRAAQGPQPQGWTPQGFGILLCSPVASGPGMS